MEKNKRLISILTVCLLTVLAILPLFSVTVSASGSYTDEVIFEPQTSITVSVEAIGTNESSRQLLHFPITYYSGFRETTVNDDLSHPYGDSLFYAWQINVQDDTPPTFLDDYTLIPQNSALTLSQTDSTLWNRITFTIRDLYVFDGYFDNLPSSVTSSLWCEITSDATGFCSSIADGSLYCRYREVGDELYTIANSTSHDFTPFMKYADNSDGDIVYIPIGRLPTTSFRLDEYTSLPFLEEGKFYHIDELKLTYYTIAFDGDEIIFNSRYYNVHNIDNIVINVDKSNIHLPLRDFTSWLGTATSGFFTAEIAPGFSLGGIVMMCLAFALVIWFLKIFAGG